MNRRPSKSHATQDDSVEASKTVEIRSMSYEIVGKRIVNDVSASLRAGEFVCLLGANGAGKSTLIRLLANELKPTNGTISCLDANQTYIDLNDAVAFLPSDLSDPPFLTVGEVVALARWNRRSESRDVSTTDLVDEALDLCGALPWRDRKFDELSGGERERAWLAFAMVQDRPFLLLDESLHAIDYNAQKSAFELLSRAAARGRGILLVTHQLDMATSTADRLWVMRGGSLVYDGYAQDDVEHIADLMRHRD